MIPQNQLTNSFSPVDRELEARQWGLSSNHMLAFVWDDDLFNCYLAIYEDITILFNV